MRKKRLWVVVGIVAVLVVLGAIVLPKRIKLYNAIKDNIETLGPEGKMFEAYDVEDDSLVIVESKYLTIGVPKDCVAEDNDVIESYKSDDEKEYVAISKSVSTDVISFFEPGYGDESEIFGIEYSFDELREGFEKLGYGIPDSTYNTHKCIYLLKEEDYSFWDYEEALAYANAAYLKGQTFNIDTNYIYEREDMYALIMERNLAEEGVVSFYINVFDPKDLNTSYLVVVSSKDRQQAYAIINSIKLK